MRKADSKAFGERVRSRREELGLSQAELGKRAGYGQQTIVYYEAGKVQRPERCASQLAEALESTREWLLYAEGPRAIGPDYLSVAELVEKYKEAVPADKARVSEILSPNPVSRRKRG